MRFRCAKKDLLRVLARTQGIADRKSSIPILSNIHVSASDSGELRVSATDLYLSVLSHCQAEVEEKGSIAVPARAAFDIVKNLPDGEVTWALENRRQIEITSGKIRFKLGTMPGEEFPPLPNPEGADFLSLPGAALSELLTLTQYAMSNDDTRPHLSASLVQKKGDNLCVAATDGHRLSKAEKKIEGPGGDFSVLVPAKGIQEIRRIVEDHKGSSAESVPKVELAHVAGNMFVRAGDVVLSVKLVDGTSPPYDKVIPQQEGQRILAQRQALVEALKRTSLLAADKGAEVRLHLEEGKLKLVGQSPDLGEGSEELEVDYSGESQVIGFNARYLLDVLSALSHDGVAFEVRGSAGPGVIRPLQEKAIDFVGVVMPMRT